ncbi:hypothetical protein [Pinibacter aurantiacus]|uniref:Uncharacterized protein n=1 Tax=Pinibacter aurantiacus TaxID=2851599 RepID=A0A9E2S940_9BACT|nr:hypothetical protein [Pinibacter aurantiacus]MBV4358166.1 hypothetical protein [Pinibacter aurantiacus]
MQQLLPEVQKVYSSAVIKKPFIGPERLSVPYENFSFVVSKRKTDFKLDFIPPTFWMVIGMVAAAILFSVILTMIIGRTTISVGGAIPALVGFLIVKLIFRSKNKSKIEQFNNSFIDIVNGIGKG